MSLSSVKYELELMSTIVWPMFINTHYYHILTMLKLIR